MNKIQSALLEYIIDKDYRDQRIQYIALLDYLLEDKEDKFNNTAGQEILSCFFFDACCNGGLSSFDEENFIKYFDDNKNLIENAIRENTNSKIELNSIDGFNNIVKNKSYLKSFIYQCKSYKNWLTTEIGKKFINAAFVHHDTKITFYKGNVSSDKFNEPINLVDEFINKFKSNHKLKTLKSKGEDIPITDKDFYQKADIYAITPDFKSEMNKIKDSNKNKNENETIDEWNKFIDKGVFIGISLKKLKGVVKNVHIWAHDNIQLSINDDSIKYDTDFNIFSKKALTEINKLSDLPNITSNISFELLINDEKKIVEIAIRSNTSGDGHAYKDPEISFKVTPTVELKFVSSKNEKEVTDAQIGKTKSLVTHWILSEEEKFTNTPNFNDYLNIINKLKTKFSNLEELTDKSIIKTYVDLINENRSTIDELYDLIKKKLDYSEKYNIITKKFKDAGILFFEKHDKNDNILFLYKLTKWYAVSWNILIILSAIGNHINDNEDNVFLQLFKFAKISVLPYLSLG